MLCRCRSVERRDLPGAGKSVVQIWERRPCDTATGNREQLCPLAYGRTDGTATAKEGLE